MLMNAPADTALLEAAPNPGWQASLALAVEARSGRSVLALNRHEGPLRVQKALYPEGEAVCQLLMLHPPAGIAGGDRLSLAVEVGAGAHAQLTTPGAGKWYRSAGPWAHQDIQLSVEAGGVLEWLPQEVIVFDRARADARLTITLAAGAKCLGWDLVCLGRTASGERFETGTFRQRIRLQDAAGRPLWREALCLEGGDEALAALAGLAGAPVFGTLWLAGEKPAPELLAALRELPHPDCRVGLTALPGLLLARVVSHSAEAARHFFEAVWALARPEILQREAVPPRIWRT